MRLRISKLPGTNLQTSPSSAGESGESGQASILLILMLGTFLLAALAFSVDLTNMWFHRQSLQTAADSACQAGAAEMMIMASGATPPAPGFVTGAASDCATSPTATICKYAGFNGYSGSTGLTATASNAVSWTFPAAVAGVTAPSGYSNTFLKVNVQENVRTWFMALLGRNYQQVAATCTCGLVGIMSAAPLVVLDPVSSGSMTLSGLGNTTIIGGPQRSIQVNSISNTAVQCNGNGLINTSGAGPNGTGGDLAVFGGPAAATCGFTGGTSGVWRSGSAPVVDPFGAVPQPTKPGASITASTPTVVAYGVDGCPEHTNPGCQEFEPGYYAAGLHLTGSKVNLFKPGLYYFDSDLNINGGDLRMAKVCTPTCGPNSLIVNKWRQTDGMIFYFHSGQMSVLGNSGTMSSSHVDSVASTDLTCDGSSPPAALSMPATVDGNVLIAQCTANGYYYDAAGDTSDVRGSPGSRGILIYQGHNNPATSTTFTGSGSLSFSGTIYYHATGYSSIFDVRGGAGTTTYMLGEVVADRLGLNGNGDVAMALNSASTINILKAGMFY